MCVCMLFVWIRSVLGFHCCFQFFKSCCKTQNTYINWFQSNILNLNEKIWAEKETHQSLLLLFSLFKWKNTVRWIHIRSYGSTHHEPRMLVRKKFYNSILRRRKKEKEKTYEPQRIQTKINTKKKTGCRSFESMHILFIVRWFEWIKRISVKKKGQVHEYTFLKW